MAQIITLALAAVALAQAITFAVILLTPIPSPPRMTLAAALKALESEAFAREAGLDRRMVAKPPLPPAQGTSRWHSEALAYGLGVASSAVRVQMLGSTPLGPGDDPRALVITVPDAGTPTARLEMPGESAPQSPQVSKLRLASDFALPAFEAAWLQADGRWVHVAPAAPLVSDWRFRLSLSFLLGLGVVIPLAWLAARRVTRPIRALAAAAGESRLGARPAFPEDGPPEVREASAALSAMHRRIEAQFQERMRMLVAIAHDLRTPLTALRLRIETTTSDERKRQGFLITRMDRMIQEILDYAASSRREAAETVDVSTLVKGQLPAADAEGNPIRFRGEAGLEAQVPPIKLGRAVANLVENAVRYANDIEVSVTREGEMIFILVADRGPGIAVADLERVQEPFERIEASRNRLTGGIGLGLTISRNLIAEMNGELRLRNRDGGGLAAVLILGLKPSDLNANARYSTAKS